MGAGENGHRLIISLTVQALNIVFDRGDRKDRRKKCWPITERVWERCKGVECTDCFTAKENGGIRLNHSSRALFIVSYCGKIV